MFRIAVHYFSGIVGYRTLSHGKCQPHAARESTPTERSPPLSIPAYVHSWQMSAYIFFLFPIFVIQNLLRILWCDTQILMGNVTSEIVIENEKSYQTENLNKSLKSKLAKFKSKYSLKAMK